MRTRRSNKRSRRQVGKGVRGALGFDRRSTLYCFNKDFEAELEAYIRSIFEKYRDDTERFSSSLDDKDPNQDQLDFIRDYVSLIYRKVKNTNRFRSFFSKCRTNQRVVDSETIEENINVAIRNILKIKEEDLSDSKLGNKNSILPKGDYKTLFS